MTVGALTVWANDGGDKVAREEVRIPTSNSVWDGTKVKLFAAKNEVVSFNLVLQAAQQVANVQVKFDKLVGPCTFLGMGCSTIQSTGTDPFKWTDRNIELFYVQYLQIKGLSLLSYEGENYDERHVPKRLRRPHNASGYPLSGMTWANRPDHDKSYPDIAVPMEAVPSFTVAANQSQSVWVDVYVPKTVDAGVHAGSVTLLENGLVTRTIPVELTVRNFSLPDAPASKTMLFVGTEDVAARYTGTRFPNAGTAADTLTRQLMDKHFQVGHRHKLHMVTEGDEAGDKPGAQWVARLDGSLFSAARGYDGPGVGLGNDVYSIGSYGQWSWKTGVTEASMRARTDAWETWFLTNFPSTTRFLYLADESVNYAEIEKWSQWMNNNPGIGKNLMSFATIPLMTAIGDPVVSSAATATPSLDVVTSGMEVGDKAKWTAAVDARLAKPDKRLFLYNGHRPAGGTFCTDDDGVSLRLLPWTQYKKKIQRWFYWQSTYYKDYQGGRVPSETNVYKTAATFSGPTTINSSKGETGWNHTNGDGVLFYPGTDTVYPTDAPKIMGPVASLRLKHWRRGVQDVDYITLANTVDAARTQAIVNRMAPKVLWEYGSDTVTDPTYVQTDISWSINPDDWETARLQLADIIEGK